MVVTRVVYLIECTASENMSLLDRGDSEAAISNERLLSISHAGALKKREFDF